MTNFELWKERMNWARRFGDVVELLDSFGCPPADDVGLAHLHWHVDPNNIDSVAPVYVTTGGFPRQRHRGENKRAHAIYLRAPDDHSISVSHIIETPAQLREFAPVFVERVRRFMVTRRCRLDTTNQP